MRSLVVGHSNVGATHQHAVAVDKRTHEINHATHERQTGKSAPLFGGIKTLRFNLNRTVHVANGSRHRLSTAHHNPFHHRLSADRNAFLFILFSFHSFPLKN